MTRKPRVLLLSASSGAGHVRAAQALEKAFAARGDCVVQHIDAIEYVSKLFQRAYDKTYISMVRRAPELMGVLYDRTDQPWQHPRRRLALDRLNSQPMIRMLKHVQPDLCVATHFFPPKSLLGSSPKRNSAQMPSSLPITMSTRWVVPHRGPYCRLSEAAEYPLALAYRAKFFASRVFPSIRFSPFLLIVPLRSALRLDTKSPSHFSPRGYGIGPLEQLVRDLLALAGTRGYRRQIGK
jgi:processive 1,2-diacylglycerol beta-glucosyltransferase